MECRHGVDPSNSAALQEIVSDLIVMRNLKTTDSLSGGASKKIYARIRKSLSRISKDDGLAKSMAIKQLHGHAIQHLLEEDIKKARLFCVCALEFRGNVTMEISTLEWYTMGRQIRSRQGLVLYLAKHSGCDCLKKMKKEIKKEVKIGRCKECGKEAPVTEHFECSTCHAEYYCSRQCQIKDWPRHKRICNKLAEMKQSSSSKPSSG